MPISEHWQLNLHFFQKMQDALFSGQHRTLENINATTKPPSQLGDGTGEIELILDVLFIFLCGIAIIVGLIILVYALVVMFDRYFGCGRLVGWNEEFGVFPDNESPSAEAYGPVAFKARLWGLTSRERRAILKYHFLWRSRPFSRFGESSAPIEAKIICEREVMKEKAEPELESENDVDSVLDERQITTTTCAICLAEYEEGDKVVHGMHCLHLFHYDCIMPWMEQLHDHCPFCRKEMMSPRDMRCAAKKILDKQRLEQVSWCKCSRPRGDAAGAAPELTTSHLSNVSDAVGQRAGTTTTRAPVSNHNNFHEYGMPPISLSREAQIGFTNMTQVRDICRNSNSQGVPPLNGAGDSDVNHGNFRSRDREAIELRLATSLNMTSVACSNSAEA